MSVFWEGGLRKPPTETTSFCSFFKGNFEEKAARFGGAPKGNALMAVFTS